MHDFDIFNTFRTAIFVGLTLYYFLATGLMTMRLVRVLSGADPRLSLLRAYLSYHLVTIRIRPLAGELAHLALWTTILAALWWMH
jgi:hypothetical protein